MNGILILLCISKTIVIHGGWILHNNYKTAINPYNSSFTMASACQSYCEINSICNGYSIDISNDKCYLSRCDNYVDFPSCSSCFFASKSPPSSPIICPSDTTTLDPSVLDTTTLEESTTANSQERTTTADISASSTSIVLDTNTDPNVLNTTTTERVLLVPTTPAPDDLGTTQFPITATTDFSVSKSTTVDSSENTSDPNDTVTLDPIAPETTKTDISISVPATTEKSTEGISTTYSLHNYSKDDLILTIGNVTCVCVCNYVNTSLEKSLEKRKKALILNKTKLSSSIRKLISAHDSRLSCTAIGVMGIVIMVIFVFLIFCLDIFSLFISIKKKENIS